MIMLLPFTMALIAAVLAFRGHAHAAFGMGILGDRFLERSACWLFMILVAGNVVAFALECGLGACPDNPVAYLWWPK